MKLKIIVPCFLCFLGLSTITGMGLQRHKTQEDLVNTFSRSIQSELDLRFSGVMSPDVELFGEEYHTDSILISTCKFLHSILPEHFSEVESPDFFYYEDVINEKTFSKVQDYISSVYSAVDVQVSPSRMVNSYYTASVQVSSVNALSGLSKETLHYLKDNEDNIDTLIFSILDYLDVPKPSNESHEYILTAVHENFNDENCFELVSSENLYDNIVVFELSPS